MEDMEHPKLGPFAETVADIRQAMADLRASEDKVLPAVLKVMHAEGRTSFRAHGVEFLRVEGEETLKVKSAGKRGKQATGTVGE
jgi:hypothetical protein